MSIYYIDISSTFNIGELTQALQDEECLFAEFKDSRIMTLEDLTVTNHAKFDECDVRPVNPVILIKSGTSAPEGKNKIWSGTMVIAGSSTAVEAYR